MSRTVWTGDLVRLDLGYCQVCQLRVRKLRNYVDTQVVVAKIRLEVHFAHVGIVFPCHVQVLRTRFLPDRERIDELTLAPFCRLPKNRDHLGWSLTEMQP